MLWIVLVRVYNKLNKIVILVLLLLSVAGTCDAQKLIEYASGIGSRDPENADIWVLEGADIEKNEN